MKTTWEFSRGLKSILLYVKIKIYLKHHVSHSEEITSTLTSLPAAPPSLMAHSLCAHLKAEVLRSSQTQQISSHSAMEHLSHKEKAINRLKDLDREAEAKRKKKKSFSILENGLTAFFALKQDYHISEITLSDPFLMVFFSLLARKSVPPSR